MANLIGLDLGKRTDPAALCVFCGSMQKAQKRYLCRAMRRWPLGTKYVRVIEDVRTLCANPMLQTNHATGKAELPTLLVDASGVGDPVTELIEELIAAGRFLAKLVAIVITGGNKANRDDDCEWRWHVPQHLLVSAFHTVLRADRFDWPRVLRDPLTGEDMRAVLQGEVKAYDFTNKNPKRPPSYGAQAGSHDDVLMSVSYVAWWGER